MAPRRGLEPPTYRLTAECSTVELSRNILPGNHLLFHPAARAVPSAVDCLTFVFGMGTGVTNQRIVTRFLVYTLEFFPQSFLKEFSSFKIAHILSLCHLAFFD